MIVVGAVLVALPYFPRSSARDVAPRPAAPPGSEVQRDKSSFVAQLRAFPQPAEGARLVEEFSAMRRRCAQLGRFLRAEARLTRVLESGFEFDSRLEVWWRVDGEHGRLRLDVLPLEKDAWIYLSDLEQMTVGRVRFFSTQMGRWMTLWERGRQTGSLGGSTSVSVGDTPMLDVLAFYDARPAELSAAGISEGLGSRPLPVIDWVRPSDSALEGSPNLGRSALFYLAPKTLALRSVRVFDDEKRLLRVIDDFTFADDDACRIRGFRVTSAGVHSHSIYRITRVDDQSEVSDSVFSPEGLKAAPPGAGAGNGVPGR